MVELSPTKTILSHAFGKTAHASGKTTHASGKTIAAASPVATAANFTAAAASKSYRRNESIGVKPIPTP